MRAPRLRRSALSAGPRWSTKGFERRNAERRACRALGQARSSQRWVSRKVEADRELLERMRELAVANPAYGYRFMWALLKPVPR